MNIHVKTLLTLAVLAVLVLLGSTWGWSSLMSPFPHHAAQKACYQTRLKPGDRVSPAQVIVSVFNASSRVGLASATMSSFADAGFASGSVGNAPKGTVVHYAQIWTTDRKSPAVQLVASRLGTNAAIVNKKHRGLGVIVIVGPQFSKLVAGKPSAKATRPTTICEAPTG